MNSRAEDLIRRHFLAKFTQETKRRYVGVEIEMPVANLAKQPVEAEFARAVLDLLRQSFGFKVTASTLEGFPVKAVNGEGDSFSFETSLNTIEFSMARNKSIREIAGRFYQYLRALQPLGKTHHHLICGLGTNPYARYADGKPLNTPVLRAKSAFLQQFTTHHNGEIFHAFSAATQTHLDIDLPSLPEHLNLLEKLSFADGLLFANSLPFPHDANSAWTSQLPQGLRQALKDQTLCFRDTLWRLCEAPNTEASERTFTSIEDIVRHLLTLKLFVVSDGKDGFKPIPPIEFSKYFRDPQETEPAPDHDAEEKDILCFRPLQPVSVSKYGTIEIRRTCTQPLAEVFLPTVFYTGISENFGEAFDLVNDFWQENKLEMTNVELRRKAVCQETIVPPAKMNVFLRDLTAVSLTGLEKRNLGEEKYLGRLLRGDGSMECPAQRQIQMRKNGANLQEIMLAYSDTDEKIL